MPQWLQNISGVHVVILISIVSSLWGVAAKAIREKAEKRRVEIAKREREENLLRSGRVEPTARVQASMPSNVRQPAPQQLDPRRMLEEIAAKRQQQLEELRRQQLSQGTATGPRTAAPRPAQSPAPIPRPARAPAPQSSGAAGGTMRPEQYEQMRRRQTQGEGERARGEMVGQGARNQRAEEDRRQAPVRTDASGKTSRRAKQTDEAQAAMLRERDRLEREQTQRDTDAAKARAVAQAAPVAAVAHSRGGSSVGVGNKAAAGITVLGATLSSKRDWRRIMAIQAILGPSTASRDLEGLGDPLRS